jgi:S-formylglutathione hydrolase FrmB
MIATTARVVAVTIPVLSETRSMKCPLFAVALSIAVVAPPILAQNSPTTRPRRPASYSGRELGGSVDFPDVESKLLGRSVRCGVYLPPGYKDDANKDQRYPLVYFLHGLHEGAVSWLSSRGGASLFDNAIKDKKIPPLIVIVPDAGYSFYSDTLDGKKPYAKFVIQELVPWADKTFRTTGRREERVMSGSSMGGFGALKFAFQHPEIFSAVFAHQAAILPDSPAEVSGRSQRVMGFLQQNGTLELLFGDPIDVEVWKASNPLSLASTAKFDPPLAIYFDCGESDSYGFDEPARAMDEVLTKRGIPHEFAIRPGTHGNEFVRSAFPYSLAFLDKHLKAQKKPQDNPASRPGGK